MRNAMLFVLTLLGASLCFGAEVYPSKAVRVVVPSGPGSGSDIVTRLISLQLSEQLGKSFVVDNRTGASGTIASAIAAKSAPDGYTLLLVDTRWTIAPGLNKSVQYDVAKDFAAITQVASNSTVLVVHPSLKANTLKEFIALAQANPGKLNYASSGTGSAIHLASELFKAAAKVNITHIPYGGGSTAALVGVAGGQVQMTIPTIASVLPYVKNGLMRALAVTGDKRSSSMPDVPSFGEAGVPGMADYVWYGFVGPAGMPNQVVNKLHAEVIKALAVASVKERFIALGSELVGSSPEEFSMLIRSELRRWAEVIKSAGITTE
ncbi:MAG: tripartite tricarboxylate transporter substrate binding protein [Betaproteobacteria bacterium]|nr:tripartite tricarboxylate transporter substrate binding protein [Betaproteobacteria bacterium]